METFDDMQDEVKIFNDYVPNDMSPSREEGELTPDDHDDQPVVDEIGGDDEQIPEVDAAADACDPGEFDFDPDAADDERTEWDADGLASECLDNDENSFEFV